MTIKTRDTPVEVGVTFLVDSGAIPLTSTNLKIKRCRRGSAFLDLGRGLADRLHDHLFVVAADPLDLLG